MAPVGLSYGGHSRAAKHQRTPTKHLVGVKAELFLRKIFSSAMLKAPQEEYPRAARGILKYEEETENSIELEDYAKFGYLKDNIDLICYLGLRTLGTVESSFFVLRSPNSPPTPAY